MIFFFFNINYSRSARCTCAKLPCRHLLPVTYTHSAHVSHHFVIAQQTHTLFCGDQTAHKTANCIKPSDLQKIPPSPKKHSFSDDFPAYKCFSCYWLFWHLQRSEWWLVWPSGSSVFVTLKGRVLVVSEYKSQRWLDIHEFSNTTRFQELFFSFLWACGASKARASECADLWE